MNIKQNDPIQPRRKTTPKPAAKILPPQLRAVGVTSSYYDNNDFENVWLSEFLSHEKARNDSLAKADLLNFTELPGSTVHPRAANHRLIRQAKCNSSSKKQSPKGGNAMIADHRERQRLDELSKTLKKTAAMPKLKPKPTTRKGQKRFTPYVEANSKIARVLQHTRPRGKLEDMQASQLNDFYKLVTKETSAAVVLQSQCRRVMAARYVNQISLETRQATRIQSFVRSFFARQELQRRKEVKRKAALMRERLVRIHVARCRRRKRIKLEHDSTILCQSVVRMFFATQVAEVKRLRHSWEVNQQRWRAVSVRLAWADLRINFYARQIHRVVRRKLAKIRVATIFAVYTQAATRIQSIWRRYLAMQQKDDAMYQLKVDEKCHKIRIITSEHRYWKQQVDELTKPTKAQLKNDLAMQKANLEKEQNEKYEQIHVLESHYSDQLELQDQITPRAIAGGWEEQVKINLSDTRERITIAKLDLMFNIQKKLKTVTKDLEEMQSNEDEAIATMEHWSAWQQSEQDLLWDVQRQHGREVEERELRYSIVDEQLKWAVKHCVASGKPDKRRPLIHRPKVQDDDERGSGQRVQQLIDSVNVKANDFQAANHLIMFQPFQRVWDQFNDLASNHDHLMREDCVGSRRVPHAFTGSLLNDTSSNKKSHSKAFPKKLPWHLLDEVREDRVEIEGMLNN